MDLPLWRGWCFGSAPHRAATGPIAQRSFVPQSQSEKGGYWEELPRHWGVPLPPPRPSPAHVEKYSPRTDDWLGGVSSPGTKERQFESLTHIPVGRCLVVGVRVQVSLRLGYLGQGLWPP